LVAHLVDQLVQNLAGKTVERMVFQTAEKRVALLADM
jgi:hypothetical protein